MNWERHGLGHSTLLGIANSHNGFINVYSQAGQGTKFTIYLPANIAEQTAQPAAKRAEIPAGHGKLILVIDDGATVRENTRSMLETFGDRVLTARAGPETLTVYAQHGSGICARLTDMMMPYMDGPATIRTLQTLNPQIKFIASSRLARKGSVIWRPLASNIFYPNLIPPPGCL